WVRPSPRREPLLRRRLVAEQGEVLAAVHLEVRGEDAPEGPGDDRARQHVRAVREGVALERRRGLGGEGRGEQGEDAQRRGRRARDGGARALEGVEQLGGGEAAVVEPQDLPAAVLQVAEATRRAR